MGLNEKLIKNQAFRLTFYLSISFVPSIDGERENFLHLRTVLVHSCSVVILVPRLEFSAWYINFEHKNDATLETAPPS